VLNRSLRLECGTADGHSAFHKGSGTTIHDIVGKIEHRPAGELSGLFRSDC
jgi:hypothetical protein